MIASCVLIFYLFLIDKQIHSHLLSQIGSYLTTIFQLNCSPCSCNGLNTSEILWTQLYVYKADNIAKEGCV